MKQPPLLLEWKEELILDIEGLLERDDWKIRLVNIFSARVKQLSLVNHKIILEEKWAWRRILW